MMLGFIGNKSKKRKPAAKKSGAAAAKPKPRKGKKMNKTELKASGKWIMARAREIGYYNPKLTWKECVRKAGKELKSK